MQRRLRNLGNIVESLTEYVLYLYIYTRLPVTRWVKLSLNFELLVKRAMKFLLIAATDFPFGNRSRNMNIRTRAVLLLLLLLLINNILSRIIINNDINILLLIII